MKFEQLQNQTNAELNKKLINLKSELFNLRFSNATNSLQNPQQIVLVKKDIARIKTVLRQRELGLAENIVETKVETKKTTKSVKKAAEKPAKKTAKVEAKGV